MTMIVVEKGPFITMEGFEKTKFVTTMQLMNSQIQHTPNPCAQLPSFVPLFDEHSSLKTCKKFNMKNFWYKKS